MGFKFKNTLILTSITLSAATNSVAQSIVSNDFEQEPTNLSVYDENAMLKEKIKLKEVQIEALKKIILSNESQEHDLC